MGWSSWMNNFNMFEWMFNDWFGDFCSRIIKKNFAVFLFQLVVPSFEFIFKKLRCHPRYLICIIVTGNFCTFLKQQGLCDLPITNASPLIIPKKQRCAFVCTSTTSLLKPWDYSIIYIIYCVANRSAFALIMGLLIGTFIVRCCFDSPNTLFGKQTSTVPTVAVNL